MADEKYQYRVAKLEPNKTLSGKRQVKIMGNVYGPAHLPITDDDHPELPIGEIVVVRYRDDDEVAFIVPDPEGSTRVGKFATEFDETYAVPLAFSEAGLVDISWHNDMCPSFGWPEDHDGNLRLFSEHPVKDLREMDTNRFLVTLGDGGGDYDESFETDDAAEALAKMRELRPKILKYKTRTVAAPVVAVPAPAPAPVAPGPLKGPRFVLLIGSIKESFPDVPEPIADGQVVCYDRQEEADVFTIFPKYAQAVCLERINESGPEGLCDWFNELSDEALISEGMAPAKQAWERPEHCRLEQIAEIIRDYHRKTAQDEYTDSGEAWEVFGQLLKMADPKAKPLD